MELWSDVEGMIGKNDMRAVWCGGIGFLSDGMFVLAL